MDIRRAMLKSPWREIALALARGDQPTAVRLIGLLSPAEALAFDAMFEAWYHEGQIEPPAEGWRTWMMLAGRGYGKTRAGAEWITRLATQRKRKVRIALVGATEDEVRDVMIEGESGLLAVGSRLGAAYRPKWEPSRGLLRWRGGSIARVFSGENPDGLRGPQHHYAWCDELAKWARPDETWDNLQMTLRAGRRPRALVTTTPRPIPLLKRILAGRWTVATRGRTDDNLNVDENYHEVMAETYGGTRLGRQELGGELIEDVEGALWTRELIERCRVILPELGSGRWQAPSTPPAASLRVNCADGAGLTEGCPSTPACGGGHEQVRIAPGNPQPCRGHGVPAHPRGKLGEDLVRVVIGVDPPASAGGDECGIVACGIGSDGIGYVLGDHSVGGLSPEGWAQAVAGAAEAWGADRVVVENNQGGDMALSVLKSADCALPVSPVRARYGKGRRAEPVAVKFELGLARFAGAFPELEDQLCGLTGAGYVGPGRSPDRADAMVWAMTELLLGPRRGEPRIRVL